MATAARTICARLPMPLAGPATLLQPRSNRAGLTVRKAPDRAILHLCHQRRERAPDLEFRGLAPPGSQFLDLVRHVEHQTRQGPDFGGARTGPGQRFTPDTRLIEAAMWSSGASKPFAARTRSRKASDRWAMPRDDKTASKFRTSAPLRRRPTTRTRLPFEMRRPCAWFTAFQIDFRLTPYRPARSTADAP